MWYLLVRSWKQHQEDYLGKQVDIRAEYLKSVCIPLQLAWYVESDISSCRCYSHV